MAAVAATSLRPEPAPTADDARTPLLRLARVTTSSQFPPRSVPVRWPASEQGRTQVLALLPPRPDLPRPERQPANARRRGLRLLVDWLDAHPGASWQERWLASGAQQAGMDWEEIPAAWLERQGRLSASRLTLMTSSVALLVTADIVRPSLRWLLGGGKKRKLGQGVVHFRDPGGFQLCRACQHDPATGPEAQGQVAFRCAMVMAAKGGLLADVTVGDILEILDIELGLRGRAAGESATFKVLRDIGVFAPDVPSCRELRSAPRRSVEELVDYYRIACRPIRDLFVDYLKERQPAVDYTTLRNHCSVLAGRFWSDLEAHHPGIDSLALASSVASAWKQRLRTRTTTKFSGQGTLVSVERLSYLDELSTVRAFYLDLAQWALDDPVRWGVWAVPCPIRPAELTRGKYVRQRKARMDARTRERLPALPVLVAAVERWRQEAAELLAAGRQTAPGQRFSAAGHCLVRLPIAHGLATNVWVQDPSGGKRRLLDREEEHAFWAWAVVHVLRHTGIRVEELLELSHHALVQYRLPSSGEVVPLLQIAPSKTDTERMLVVSPELADVLSAIISRAREGTGAVPRVRARDYHELVWLPPAPLLFQHHLGVERHGFSIGLVGTLLDEALARTGLTDQTGSPLRCTPHDFRRMFITEAVMNGLPPHIAQVIAGHQDLNVTMGYKAVYPEEAIEAHLGFLARRRALRPSEEYRTPTDEEWQEFLGHFERRKVSIGTCARAFGTPCIHEHSCVRCPMLWPDPAQRTRLAEICDNLTARIAEAEAQGWLGEVEGLHVSLAGAKDKLAQVDRRNAAQPVKFLPEQTRQAS
jgi:integrase